MPSETEKRWIAAWRLAGPELERIRREELRSLPETPIVEPAETPEDAATRAAREKASCGLVAWQQWMMRLRILELQKQRAGNDSQ